MDYTFYKYHGTGNDFILIDDRDSTFPQYDVKLIAGLCQRRFGIGADGLILLQSHQEVDFKMVYFNSDGSESTMCGNGGRCLVQFAYDLNIIGENTLFEAIDGMHSAIVHEDGTVALHMIDTENSKNSEKGFFIDTGSPHHVEFVEKTEGYPVFETGRKYRNEIYGAEGANINFVEMTGDEISVRTYERGVEDETYSCGTGVTAAALVAFQQKGMSANPMKVKTLGGELSVSFEVSEDGFKNVILRGPATFVFDGQFSV